MIRLFPIVACFFFGFAQAQVVHPNAHAHNDYEHTKPLLDALQNGFASIEADIHLIQGTLYVSHHRPQPSTAITLEALYLRPLDSLTRLHGAKSITLLLDIKSEATATLVALIAVLTKYPVLFPPDHPRSVVQAVISGNRDYNMILNENLVAIDGRPGDLGKGFSPDKMPYISDHYKNWMHWSGKGQPSQKDLDQVRALARRVHAEGKKLRLWAIPDQETAWQALLDAGVDLINTDRLEELSRFLVQKGK
jgi:hypothetical protein